MTVTLRQYDELMRDLPKKFTPEEVSYRKADGKESCSGCWHFYTHEADGDGACEIMRGDDVKRDWVCMFFTRDGKLFPLYRQKESSFDWKRNERG